MIRSFKLLNQNQKVTFFFIAFLAIFSSYLEVIGISVISIYVAALLGEISFIEKLPFNINQFFDFNIKTPNQILTLSGILILIFFIKNLFIGIIFYITALFNNNVRVSNANKLFKEYLNTGYTFYLENNPAQILRNLTKELRDACNFFVYFIALLKEIFFVITIFISFIFIYGFKTIIFISFLILLSAIFILIFRNKVKKISSKSIEIRGKVIQLINESIGLIKQIILRGNTDYYSKLYTENYKKESIMEVNLSFINHLPKLIIEFFGILFVTIFIAFLVIKFGTTFNSSIPLISFVVLASIKLLPSFFNITTSLTTIKSKIVSVDLILNTKKKLKPRDNIHEKIDKDFSLEKIEFKNIDFQYKNTNEKILKNLSFVVNKNETLGIFGISGSGKSTLVNLMMGIFDPLNGQILINNKELLSNKINLQKSIGYVSQDIYLADDSLNKNIAFGVEEKNIDIKRIHEVCKQTNLENFLRDHQNSKKTLGYMANRISGGQMQRLSLARALYHNPQLLVLDEFTSNLDKITEEKILNEISGIKITKVIISHNEKIKKYCDQIIKL
tara:strand:+ start:5266 stop:6945 length:1680 start_codon:yes stop_codon:yes gene_type:complete